MLFPGSVQTEITLRACLQLGNIPLRGLVSTIKWFSQSVSHSNRFTTVEIRIDQLEACYTLCAAQDKEGLLVGKFEPGIFRRNWETFIEDGEGAIIGLYSDDSLCGILGGTTVCDSQTGSLIGKTLFYYIRKDVLTRSAALALFTGFQQWALAQGARYVMVTLPLGEFQLRLEQSLRGDDYKAHTITYKKQL